MLQHGCIVPQRSKGIMIMVNQASGLTEAHDAGVQLSRFFWWSNLVRLYSLYKILYPKRRI